MSPSFDNSESMVVRMVLSVSNGVNISAGRFVLLIKNLKKLDFISNVKNSPIVVVSCVSISSGVIFLNIRYEIGGNMEIIASISPIGRKSKNENMPIITIKNLIIAPITREIILVTRLLSLVESPGFLSTKAVFLYGAKKVLRIAGIEK